MDVNKSEAMGNLCISNEVIAAIVKTAALEVNGVDSISIANSGVRGFFSKTNYAKPIKIEMSEELVGIEVNVIVKNGSSIPDVADAIQQNVKNAVQNMTGLAVSRVDIVVCGISKDGLTKEE